MNWESQPLFAKAKAYFARAFDERDNDELFGLWCSFGLELLARSAVASISPALLAEPEPDHAQLLHVFGRGRGQPKSIGTSKVVSLCGRLFPGFTKEDGLAVLALTNRRNEELHSASTAFATYPSKDWLQGFYRVCNSLTLAMGESIESLFGTEHAKSVRDAIHANENEVRDRVLKRIAAYRSVFEGRPSSEQAAARQSAANEAECYHRRTLATCPACGAQSLILGRVFGPQHTQLVQDGIQIQQEIIPSGFQCNSCRLELIGYPELHAAGIGGRYFWIDICTPEKHYGMVDRSKIDCVQALLGPTFDLGSLLEGCESPFVGGSFLSSPTASQTTTPLPSLLSDFSLDGLDCDFDGPPTEE